MADDIKSRYSIFVPSPKARINLGKPDLDAPFGYTGLSLQSDVHFLVDVNKHSMFQSGGTSCWQVGGKWLQWSNGPMQMSSTAAASFTASDKITIASGAAQGQITALDHGTTPRMVEYNNLDLHYRVEEVHNSLKRLFYGAGWKTEQKDSQEDQINGYASGANPAYPPASFLGEMAAFLKEIGHKAPAMQPLLQPLEWEGNHIDHRLKQTSDYNPFKAFDPYASMGYSGPVSKGFAKFLQTATALHRFIDVLGKVGPMITDNFVGARVQRLMAVWGDAQGAMTAAMRTTDFARFDNSKGKYKGDGKWAQGDEWANVNARVPTGYPAKLQSNDAPYDIALAIDTKLTIKDNKGSAGTVVDLAPLLTRVPAEIAFVVAEGAIGPSLSGEILTLSVDGKDSVIPLEDVKGDSSEARALALSTAINACGVSASASGPRVVMTTNGDTLSGVITSSGLGSWDGFYSSCATYNGTITLEQLTTLLTGQGKYTLSSSDKVLSVEHDTKGPQSYLCISGELTNKFFEDAEDSGEILRDGVDGIADLTSMQYEMAKWPEDLRNQLRPVQEALKDVVTVYDKIQSIITGVMSVAGSIKSSPKAMGLIAGGAMSLGAKAGMYQSGKSVTIVATGIDEKPDKKKYIPRLEFPIAKLTGLGSGADDWMAAKFKPTGKANGLSGFRVVSGNDIVMMAKQQIYLAALDTIRAEAAGVHFVSNKSASIASRTESVSMFGKRVVVGSPRASIGGKQVATRYVSLRATKGISATVNKARVSLNDGCISLGLRKDKTFAPDETSAFLKVDVSAGSLDAGVGSGANFAGLTVPKDGKVVLTADTNLTMAVNSGAGIKVSKSAVELVGASFKVGGSLLVKSSGTFSRHAASKMDKAKAQLEAKVSKLKAKRLSILADAKALKAKIMTAKALIRTLRKSIRALPPLNLLALPKMKGEKDDAIKLVQGYRSDLDDLRISYEAMAAEADAYDVSDDVGISDTDADDFAVP